jgi:hypothetical protein
MDKKDTDVYLSSFFALDRECQTLDVIPFAHFLPGDETHEFLFPPRDGYLLYASDEVVYKRARFSGGRKHSAKYRHRYDVVEVVDCTGECTYAQIFGLFCFPQTVCDDPNVVYMLVSYLASVNTKNHHSDMIPLPYVKYAVDGNNNLWFDFIPTSSITQPVCAFIDPDTITQGLEHVDMHLHRFRLLPLSLSKKYRRRYKHLSGKYMYGLNSHKMMRLVSNISADITKLTATM